MTRSDATSCTPVGSTPSARGPTSSSTATAPRAWSGPRSCAPGSDRPRRWASTSPRRRWPTSPTPRRSGTARPLQLAVERVESELRRTAEDGDLVVAVTDAETRILWTYGGRVMRRKAETVNFVPGGRWDDTSVGTNALDLATRHDAPSMVFSAEHYAPIVHNWVCWAAPVHDPVSGEQLGVIDLSTTWDRTHPIGLATARVMARLIETAMPASQHHPGPRRCRSAPPRRRARPDAARRGRGAPRRQPAAAQPPADRDPGAARAEPRPASRSSSCTPCSTATRRSPSPPSRPRSPTCAAPSRASSPRGPTG